MRGKCFPVVVPFTFYFYRVIQFSRTLTLHSFLDSKPFTFLVGPDRRPILVQSRLFNGISEPLTARMLSEEDNGRWRNPVSEIEDVEWEVFVGLVEFAYTGDYWGSLPRARKDTDDNDNDQTKEVEAEQPKIARSYDEEFGTGEPAAEEAADWPSHDRIKKKDKRVRSSTCGWCGNRSEKVTVFQDEPMGLLLWQQFKNLSDTLAPSTKSAEVAIDKDSMSATLLYHAKLCVLADRNLIPSLRDKCLANLYQNLAGLDLNVLPVSDVLDLVDFVYTEEGVQGVPKLKDIVLSYIAAKLGICRQDERLKSIMEKHWQLGADLVYTLSGTGNWLCDINA